MSIMDVTLHVKVGGQNVSKTAYFIRLDIQVILRMNFPLLTVKNQVYLRNVSKSGWVEWVGGWI